MEYDSLQFCRQLIGEFEGSDSPSESAVLASLKVSEQHLTSSPDAAAVHNNFGQLLRMFPKYEHQAEMELLKAIELDPELPDPYYNLGLLYQFKRKDEAVRHLEKAIKLYQAVDRSDGADMARGLLEDIG